MRLSLMMRAATSALMILAATASGASAQEAATQMATIDMARWQYDEVNDVYWQVGIAYCQTPADVTYETLGIYVPGAYMTATANGDGTYACAVNASGEVGGFTAATAPIVLPVNTPGYSAMAAPTGYDSSTAAYTDAGMIYVHAGCRGRDAGAPAGVTDLKAAIRYNADVIPGDTERIFSFGMSGGGAQSALLGATGDSALYTPYLEAIGAVEGVSDAVAGAMCWCPITSLDYADAAYEWNMGATRTGLSDEMQALSDALATRFAEHINALGLTDAAGNALTLEPSETGVYQAGSYYEYILGVIEDSLNAFLASTEFPYTVQGASGMGGGHGMGERGERPQMDGDLPQMGGDMPQMGGDMPQMDGDMPQVDGEAALYAQDGIARNQAQGGVTLSGTYETAQDYIDALNAQGEWVVYDAQSNTARVTSVAGFASALKRATKDLGAFDDLDCAQGENVLFGDGDGQGDHFDAVMASLLADTQYGDAFAAALARTDALGSTVQTRVDMYTPLYYLNASYAGYGTANVAAHWRIRSGINQSDTALTTEVNLALALEAYGADVDFEAVWGQGHVQAESTGDSTQNFIAWVTDCCM